MVREDMGGSRSTQESAKMSSWFHSSPLTSKKVQEEGSKRVPREGPAGSKKFQESLEGSSWLKCLEGRPGNSFGSYLHSDFWPQLFN